VRENVDVFESGPAEQEDVKGEDSAPADTFYGCDGGALLHHDAAHGADQISGIPPGAVRHVRSQSA